VATATFLGTGSYLAQGRYWNSFVLDGRVLVEPSPTVLPHLRRCGIDAGDLEAVVISHFHPDHTFGWPFLLLELLRVGHDRPLTVLGPPGVERFLAEMMQLAAVPDIAQAADDLCDLRYVEVDGGWQAAGPFRVRGVEVDHVDHLRCFGYLFERDGHTVAYSGDCRPCPGLDEMAGATDVLVLECNGAHPPPKVHHDPDDVRALRRRFPRPRFVLTHLGAGLDLGGLADTVVPDDFDVLEL
jgi:ribonuclease BN (tRNA processing enzyme)